jgi:DNA-directed RNA polymerase subunit RPC12/RpoP
VIELFCEQCSAVKQFDDNAEIEPDNTVTCPDCGRQINVDDTPLESRKH